MSSLQFDGATLANAQRHLIHQTDAPKTNLTRAAHSDRVSIPRREHAELRIRERRWPCWLRPAAAG